jgi:mannose-1-phosphate guanylyltransferase
VCNDTHYFYCQDQISLLALYWAEQGEGDTPMLVMPADHALKDVGYFKTRIESAMPYVHEGRLATLYIAWVCGRL